MSAEARAAPIRTPDQRLRVFVSSTLKELEPERRAARAAIERLHLAPVMFELGARPHPPRQLYRAYLDQSDVFVGVYWQEYGWIAPGEEISGLEDEYRLDAAETLRARTGIADQRSYITYQSFVDAVLATDRAAEFEASRVVGRRMPRRAVLEIALDPETVAAASGSPGASEVVS